MRKSSASRCEVGKVGKVGGAASESVSVLGRYLPINGIIYVL